MTCEGTGTLVLESSIHAGATTPYVLKYDVTTGDSEFNLTSVTAARFDVLRGNGQTATWTCTLSNQTTTTVRLTHAFSQADVPEADTLILEPRLTVPGGELVCQIAKLTVRRKFE